MRLPRFRIRALMIIVAVVALVLGGNDLRRRHSLFRQRAVVHRRQADFNRFLILVAADERKGPGGSDSLVQALIAKEEDTARRRADYHESLVAKYEHAAHSPWRSVPPDPPEPK